MKLRVIVTLCLFSLLGDAAASAAPAAGKPPEKAVVPKAKPAALESGSAPARWAVVVGVGRYDDDSIAPLALSAADARAVRDALVDPNRCAFPPENVALLTDGAEEAKLKPTRMNVLARLRAWAEMAGPNDTFLFYFSGHGVAENGRGFLLPADARIGLLADSAISTARVDEILTGSKAKETVLILDACHSAAAKDAGGMSAEFSQSLFSDADGRVTMASCQENQQSFEWKEKGQSVYTFYVLEGLRGDADSNKDGAVTVTELNGYAHEKVVRWAAENGRQQKPRARMNIAGDIILARSGPRSPGAPPTLPALLPARLQVESVPPGAQVLLDGVKQGETPCEVVVGTVTGEKRPYKVAVEKEGYHSQALAFDLAGGEVIPLEVELEAATAPTEAPGTAPGASTPPARPARFPGGRPRPGAPPPTAPRPTTTAPSRTVSTSTVLDALHALNSGPPRLHLTGNQGKVIRRILAPLQGKQTISPEEAEGLAAQIRPVLRPEQRVALSRARSQRSPGARPPQRGAPGEDAQSWRNHPFLRQMPPKGRGR